MSDVTANLDNTPVQFDTTMDVVIIKKVDHDIAGGKTLDVTGVTEAVLKAGRVIIENDTTKVLKPLKIVDGAYESKPSGHSYKGILIATIKTSKPFASVMLAGNVNEAAIVNYELPAVPSGAKTALTHILFTQD
jgi:hypothetical protein